MVRDMCEFLLIDEKKVDRIRNVIGDESDTLRVSDVFSLLADNTRLRIVSALEQDDLCVCDIASLMELSQPSVSHHLRALRQAGIVGFRKSGKMAIYSISDKRIGALLAVARDFAGK